VVRDLEDLRRRRPDGDRDVPLRVGGEQRVDASVARHEDDRVVVRIVARQTGAVRPEHFEAERAHAQPLAGADGENGHVLLPRCRDGGVMVLAFRRDARVEHRPDLDRVEHVCGAADVIALRMCQDERDQALHAEALELSGDVSLGRALVDENRTLGNLEQDPVSLADVEHRDPEPVRERRGLAGNAPPGGDQCENRRGDRCRTPEPRPARNHEHGDERRRPEEGKQCAPRLDLRVRQAADRPRAEREIRGQPAVDPGEGRRGLRQHRVKSGGCEGEAEERGNDRRRERVGDERVDGDRPEMKPEDGSRRSAACSGERDDLGELDRQRVALQPRLDPRDEDEDCGDGGERELEARLEQAVRAPREQDGRSYEQEIPAVARAGREPGERREPARDARPHD